MINRHIINPDINYDGANRDDLFRLINRWKRLLISKQISRGDIMALGIFDVSLNHVACLFAAAELSLKIFIITKPLAKETIHATKMGIHGPVDITISQRIETDNLHIEMFERYSKQICYEDEIDQITDDTDILTSISSNDPLIFASTSGTTGTSKPILFTHDEAYKISQRNISVFGYTKENVVQQTVNMHHVSAMLTYLFPTLMACDTHYVGGIAFTPQYIQNKIWYPIQFVETCLTDRKVDNIICANSFMLSAIQWGMTEANRLPEHRITINMSGFPAGPEIYDMAKQYPIDFISHYGSIDTGIPLLVNKITHDSVYEPGYIGKLVDDFYRIVGNMVYSDLWSEPRPVPDTLLVEEDRFYYSGRKEEHPLYTGELKQTMLEQLGDHDFVVVNSGKQFIVIWNKQDRYDIENGKTSIDKVITFVYLNKEDFMVDTKVSMEQLRAYLEHHYTL